MGDRASIVDVEGLEERVVYGSTHLIRDPVVEGCGVAAEIERHPKKLRADIEFGSRLAERLLDPASIERQTVKPLSDAGLRQHAVSCKVDEPLLLHVKLGQLCLQRVMTDPRVLEALIHRLLEERLCCIDEVGRQLQGWVDAFNTLLHDGDREVGQIAEAFLAASAEEVSVALAVATPGFGVDQATGPALLLASVAEQHPFEVVEDDAVPLAPGAPRLQNLLNSVK